MSAMEPLYHLMKFNTSTLTQEESFLLEAELFTLICEELKETFRVQYRNYFYSMKFTIEMENSMLDTKFIELIINDILSTNEYNLKGIAHYTDTFEDVLEEIMIGLNTNPSATFLRKLIDLHRIVRSDRYDSIIKKISTRYLTHSNIVFEKI